jgi:hypothetical protein
MGCKMSTRIAEFDLWRPGYGGAVVSILVAGTMTLASVFTDEALTIVAPNPQTLSSKSAPDGTAYGKFPVSLYTAQSYQLSINGIEDTGIVRPPFSDLTGEDTSQAVVTGNNSNSPISLANYVALVTNAATFGQLVEGTPGVAATNTATIALAIAALSGGGEVIIPGGTYKVNSFSIPEGVVIVGQGREATILQSILGDVSFTLTGDRSGFKNITLDGSALSGGSIGIKSVGNDETVFDSVMVKRFETGMHFLGGKGHVWNDLSIDNTVTGAKLHGDLDAGGSNDGAAFQDMIWTGGLVDVASTIGISLSYEDAICQNLTFDGIGFENCPGVAVNINGAQSAHFPGCWFLGNTGDVNILDDTAVLTGANFNNNKVIDVSFTDGRMNAGTFVVTGTAQNIALKNQKIEGVTFTPNTPINHPIVLENCFQDAAVTITGDTTKLINQLTMGDGQATGLTTSAVQTKAWSIALVPGQEVYLEAKVIGRGRNVAHRAIYHHVAGAYRVGSALAYDAQTANFTVGHILTGASSGATARIQADSDSGTTGTLTLINITGTFIDNEIITDDNGTPGSATVNGTIVGTAATLDGVGDVAIRTDYETTAGWNIAFVANGNSIELQVLGAASETVEWTVNMSVVST